MQELGFIIKRFIGKKQKFSIVSRSFGKINLFVSSQQLAQRLCPGMLISFSFDHSNSKIYFANNVEILMSPTNIDERDLCWLHQMFEYCYFFLLLHNPNEYAFNCIFRSIYFLTLKSKLLDSFELVKKLFIVSLLCEFDFEIDNQFMRFIQPFRKLVFSSVDFQSVVIIKSLKVILDNIDSNVVEMIDNWILVCIRSHPNVSYFKTMRFINLSG